MAKPTAQDHFGYFTAKFDLTDDDRISEILIASGRMGNMNTSLIWALASQILGTFTAMDLKSSISITQQMVDAAADELEKQLKQMG